MKNPLQLYGGRVLGVFASGRRFYVTDDFGNLVEIPVKSFLFNAIKV